MVWKYLIPLVLFCGCQKKTPLPAPLPDPSPVFRVQIEHLVSGAPLIHSTTEYTSAAGYPYSVATLQYYISGLSLVSTDGSRIMLRRVQYVDAFVLSSATFTTGLPPEGAYTSVEFTIGLDSAQNISFSLPPTEEHLNMQWPDPMGGGYHFLKLEGYFTGNEGSHGYAIHLGKNGHAVPVSLPCNSAVTADSRQLTLVMDVNEWLQNPVSYDFERHGNYTMGIDSLMKVITENGKDVFTIR